MSTKKKPIINLPFRNRQNNTPKVEIQGNVKQQLPVEPQPTNYKKPIEEKVSVAEEKTNPEYSLSQMFL